MSVRWESTRQPRRPWMVAGEPYDVGILLRAVVGALVLFAVVVAASAAPV